MLEYIWMKISFNKVTLMEFIFIRDVVLIPFSRWAVQYSQLLFLFTKHTKSFIRNRKDIPKHQNINHIVSPWHVCLIIMPHVFGKTQNIKVVVHILQTLHRNSNDWITLLRAHIWRFWDIWVFDVLLTVSFYYVEVSRALSLHVEASRLVLWAIIYGLSLEL